MSSVFNKAGWIVAGVLAIAVVASITGVVFGGPLNPPGPPTVSTQANLIYQPSGCADFPITVAGGRSWKLAQDIIMPAGCAKDGIHVIGDTTLDLEGFRLVGVPGALSGIAVVGETANIEIRNGTVLNWPSVGIELDDTGSNFAANSRVDDVRLYNNRTGITLGSSTSVTNSSISQSGCYGIYANQSGNLISGNTIAGDGGGCSGSIGIELNGNGNRAEGNVILGTGSFAIGIGGSSNTVVNSTIAGSGAKAILVVGNANQIDGNTIDANGQTNAIHVLGTSNTIVRNSSTNASGTDFNIAGGNNAGPTQTGNPLGTNPWANMTD